MFNMEERASTQQLCVFNQYYKRYYSLFALRCTRAVKDDVVASGMVQDAFLRVWMLRNQLPEDGIYGFLKLQLKKAVSRYYGNGKARFQASLFRLDELENPDFLLSEGIFLESDEMGTENGSPDAAYREQWMQVERVMPSLTEAQKHLVKLCLKHNFSYDRMAYYLGGISDYAVAKQVEAMLKNLKTILTEGHRLEQAGRKRSFATEGSLDEVQQQVMRLRYELAYSFGEIASALGMGERQVRLAYASACRICS